jgi:hypothetical protein
MTSYYECRERGGSKSNGSAVEVSSRGEEARFEGSLQRENKGVESLTYNNNNNNNNKL